MLKGIVNHDQLVIFFDG